MRRCLVKGSVLRSVVCLPTHPVVSIAPSQRIYIIYRDPWIYPVPPIAPSQRIYIILSNSQGFKDIHGDIYAWRYIWEYVCVEERVSETPPCGCAAYMWICGIVCVVAGERESEREGGRLKF